VTTAYIGNLLSHYIPRLTSYQLTFIASFVHSTVLCPTL